MVQGPAAQVQGDVEDLGQFRRSARRAHRPAEPARWPAPQAVAGAASPMPAPTIMAAPGRSVARSTTLSATRKSPALRSSRATATASGRDMRRPSFRRGSSSQWASASSAARCRARGPWKPLSTARPTSFRLRQLYLVDRPGSAKPDWTYNMLVKHGVRSVLEYAKSFDLERARAVSNPRTFAAPRIRRCGWAWLCEGSAHR